MKPETKTRITRLAEEMAGLLTIEQGHFEVHLHKGRPTNVVRVDKSIKLEQMKGHDEA